MPSLSMSATICLPVALATQPSGTIAQGIRGECVDLGYP